MRTHDFGPDNNNANDCSLKLGLSFVTIWRCEQESNLRRETPLDLLERGLLTESELDEIESETEESINRLSSNIAILERCNKDWSTLILKETKGEAKATEE